MPRFGEFSPGKRPGTHLAGRYVSRTADLDGYGKSRPHRHSIPENVLYEVRTKFVCYLNGISIWKDQTYVF
jgi:hypothetical protein